MQIEITNLNERQWLQSRLNSILNGIKTRDVQLVAQVHSNNVATIIISISGRYGVLESVVVLHRTSTPANIPNTSNPETDDPLSYVWYGYANGYKYRFAGITEIGTLVTRHVSYMKANLK